MPKTVMSVFKLRSIAPKKLLHHVSGVGQSSVMEERVVGHELTFENNVRVVLDGHLDEKVVSAELVLTVKLEPESEPQEPQEPQS